MTLKSPEFFAEQFLPTLNKVTSFTQTARALNFDESTPHVWIRESKAAMKRGDDPSDYLFEYDGSKRYLHQHIKAIGRATISDIEANARARARDGWWRVCRFQGRTVFREDVSLQKFDDATLDMLGIPDRLLRDANGQPVPEMEWIAPSTDLVIAVLAANSETYRKRSAVDVNMNARVSGGVLVMGGPRPQVAAPLPVLEIVQNEAEPERALTDEPDLTVRNTDPDQPAEAIDDQDEEPAPTIDPGPMIRTPTPADLQPGRNPLIDPAKAASLRDQFLASLPTDNASVRAALKGVKA